MSIYIIAIGGTGAKFAEAVVRAAAAGIYADDAAAEDLHILFMDPDTGNGNLAAAYRTLNIYQNFRQRLGASPQQNLPLMPNLIEIQGDGVWSPFQQGKVSFKDEFGYDNYRDTHPVRHLMDVLYTAGERDVSLHEGFRGKPAVGAAIISKFIRSDGNTWSDLVQRIQADCNANKSVKVFLCGSIFGGTGASGFPTLGKLITKELLNKKLRDKIKVGGLLMLPYFQFPVVWDADNPAIYAKPEEFIPKTEAALRYYASLGLNSQFDTVYLLGNPNLTSVDKFSPGGSGQRNPSHFLEFLGALGLQHFVFTPKPPKPQAPEVVFLSRKSPNAVDWDDLPNKYGAKAKLVNAGIFAFVWLTTIVPQLNLARSTTMQRVVWSLKFFNRDELISDEEQEKLKEVSNWCQDYLQWLRGLHSSSANQLQWFDTGLLQQLLGDDGQVNENEKVVAQLRANITNWVKGGRNIDLGNILSKLNANNGIQEANRGTVGLVKSLYRSISQQN